MSDHDDLSDRDRAILAFEGHRWRFPGQKDQAIRDTFDATPTRYYQELAALIDRPEGLAYAPTLVKRLRRLAKVRAVERGLRAQRG